MIPLMLSRCELVSLQCVDSLQDVKIIRLTGCVHQPCSHAACRRRHPLILRGQNHDCAGSALCASSVMWNRCHVKLITALDLPSDVHAQNGPASAVHRHAQTMSQRILTLPHTIVACPEDIKRDKQEKERGTWQAASN